MAKLFFRRSPNTQKDGGKSLEAIRIHMTPPPLFRSDSYLQLPTVQRLSGIKQVLKSNYLYTLLVFVPIGILSGAMQWDPTLVFLFNILAIVPLAMLLNFATEELSVNAGQTVGVLLNATFGNAVEMIVSTVALLRGEIQIVQASMLGAILSNILLGLGCCLFIGGYRHDCHFNAEAASAMASLMAVSSTSLVIPAALNFAYHNHDTEQSLNSILVLSRGTAIILLILYVFYLYFQLKSHSQLFEESDTCGSPKASEDPKTNGVSKGNEKPNGKLEISEAEEPTPRVLSPPEALVTLFAITMTIALCAEYLVGTIDEVGEIFNINRTFIGLVVLPVVGNAAEHISAMIAASKNKLDLAIGVALGSSLQIALFVTPTLVLVGWVIQQPMSLSFDPFGAIVFFLSVILVSGLIVDGKSDYLEGSMLLGLYFIIALAFLVYPEDAT